MNTPLNYDSKADRALPIALRTSCLIERANACAIGFERIGLRCSAETTRLYLAELKSGAPSALYEHQIGEQEKRLAGKREAGNV